MTKSYISGDYYFLRTVREKIYPNLIATVEETNQDCSHCDRALAKGDKVVIYEEYESVQISHIDHFHLEAKE